MSQNEIMRQAARMQRKIQQIHEQMKQKHWTAKSAGDKVSATVTGERKVVRIEVDPAFFQSEERDLVLDSIAAAINTAGDQAEKEVEQEVNKATGGLKIPGLL